MKIIHVVAFVLIIVGGLNWGLVGLFDFDLVTALLGNGAAETATSSAAARVVYVLVALSALFEITTLSRLISSDPQVRL